MADEPSDDVQAVLDYLAELDRPETHELTPERAREATRALRGDEPVAAVGAVTEQVVLGPARGIPIRIYEPASDGPHPVVVFFHGGGFVVGDPGTHDASCRLLTNAADVAVVSVDYRLAPEHPFPAAVEDAYAATGVGRGARRRSRRRPRHRSARGRRRLRGGEPRGRRRARRAGTRRTRHRTADSRLSGDGLPRGRGVRVLR